MSRVINRDNTMAGPGMDCIVGRSWSGYMLSSSRRMGPARSASSSIDLIASWSSVNSTALGDKGCRVDDDLGHLAPVRDQPLAGFLHSLNVTVRDGTNPLQTQVTPRQNSTFACIGSTEAAGVLKVVGIGGESSPPNRCIDQTAKVDAWAAADASLTRNGCCLLGPIPLGAGSGAGAKEGPMSIVKMVELSAQSPDSWEEATRQAVERAARTLRNIRSVWVKEFEAVVENEQVTQFRVILKIAFQLDEGASARSTRSMGDEEILGLD